MRNEIEFAQDAIERATGRRPVGFRAPGYTVTDELLGLIEHAGFLYDSSVFPCPVYWAAKGAAISAIRLRGRRSHSVLVHRRVDRSDEPGEDGPLLERGRRGSSVPIQGTRRRVTLHRHVGPVAGPLMRGSWPHGGVSRS